MTIQAQIRQGRRNRILRENLTAYAFLFPAALLIFLFGLFPLVFAFFVSLHRWRRFPDEYIGLGNYERALGNLTYVVFFWLGLAALGLGAFLLWRLLRGTVLSPHPLSPSPTGREETSNLRSRILYLLPGLLNAAAILLFIRWAALLLPVILNIPVRQRGQERVQGLFVNELFASFRFPEVADAGNTFLLGAIIALAVSFAIRRLRLELASKLLWQATGGLLGAAVGILILQLTQGAMTAAIDAARAEGTELPLWSQVILISGGALLLGAAYWLWRRAASDHNDRRFLLFAITAILLLGGGTAACDVKRGRRHARQLRHNRDVRGAGSADPTGNRPGTGVPAVPELEGKDPVPHGVLFALHHAVHRHLDCVFAPSRFDHQQHYRRVRYAAAKWLLEPTPVGKLILGAESPTILNGPSLALVVIIIYTIWTYAGYATVVFLAGLGNISGELYEAARIDGANGWQVFRRITLPLLSPTTFFLSLVAIIGTFQAFTQLWIMRNPASSRTTDTLSIYIFRQLTDSNPNYGYGSALAFVLFGVILLLTIFQNRIAGRRVFYG